MLCMAKLDTFFWKFHHCEFPWSSSSLQSKMGGMYDLVGYVYKFNFSCNFHSSSNETPALDR
jgi:hypothetical protein